MVLRTQTFPALSGINFFGLGLGLGLGLSNIGFKK
jgi:hypothetical protein